MTRVLLGLLLAAGAAQNDDPNVVLRVCNGTCGASPNTLRGSWGEAMTVTRATAATCPHDNGSFTQVPPGVPCLARGAGQVNNETLNYLQTSAITTCTGNPPWIIVSGRCSCNTVTAPDGTSTAVQIVDTAATGTVGIKQPFGTVLGTPNGVGYLSIQPSTITFSAYAQAGSLSFAGLADNTLTTGMVFNVVTCTAVPTANMGSTVAPTSYTTQSLNGGWCRLSITYTETNAIPNVFLLVGDSANDVFNGYTGSNANAMNFWGAQAEVNNATGLPGPYCPSTASAGAIGLPAACGESYGVRSEDAVTNLMQQYNLLGGSAWGASPSPPTVVDNSTDLLAPDNTYTATKITFATVTGAQISVVDQNFTGTAASYTGSVYVRTLSGTCTEYIIQKTSGGTYASTQFTATTTWSRPFAHEVQLAATDTYELGTDLTDGSEVGTTGCTLYAWGAQEELTTDVTNAPNFVSPVCPTAGATATCNSETIGPTNFPALGFSSTEGCIAYTITPDWTGNPPTSINYITGGGSIFAYVNAGNGAVVQAFDGTHAVGVVDTFTAGSPIRLLTTWSASANVFSISGLSPIVVASTSAFTSLSGVNQITLGPSGGAVISNIVVGKSSTSCY
jgi:hypothetical protein